MTMDVGPLLKSYVTALIVRSILYGLYFTSLVHCLRWILFEDRERKLRKHIDWRAASITVFIFFFLTTALGITSQITLDLIQGDKHSAMLAIVKISIENFAVLITNAVLIWRCWVVYTNKSRWAIVLPPFVLWVLGLASATLIVYFYVVFLHTHPGVPMVFSRLVHHSRFCWIGFYCCDISVNIFTTAAIIFRLRGASESFRQSSRQLHTTCKILALFGTLYTITTILSLTSLIVDVKSKHDTLRFTLDAINFTMPGITFNLVQVRVRQERASQSDQTLCDPRSFSKFTQAASASAGSQTWPYNNNSSFHSR